MKRWPIKHGYIDAAYNFLLVKKKIYYPPFYFYNKYIRILDGGGGNQKYDFEINENEFDGVKEIFIGDQRRCIKGLIYYDPETKKVEDEVIVQNLNIVICLNYL